jgi:hypothetical protein
MLMDNGTPWGNTPEHPYTPFTVGLLRLGILVSHGRPYHPQTQGKDKRFYHTLEAEVLRCQRFSDLSHCQKRFEEWRHVYHHQRPHEALGMEAPASRYRPSPRAFPEALPPIEYGPGDIVGKVGDKGRLSYQGREFKVPKAFQKGYPMALRPTDTDGVLFFCAQHIATLDLREHNAT